MRLSIATATQWPGSLQPVVGLRLHHANDRRRITTVIGAAGGYVRTQDNDGTRYVWTTEGLRRNWIELDEQPNVKTQP